MPRLLLRDGRVVEDDWRYLEDAGVGRGGLGADVPREGLDAQGTRGALDADAAREAPGAHVSRGALGADAAREAPGAHVSRGALGADAARGALIVPFDRWVAEREAWLHAGRLGVLLKPADKVEQLAPDIARFALIAADFPGPSEGRGYTQGRLLRERWKFGGELRAVGYVRRDQLFFLARCGFNSFELPESELTTAAAAFSTFTAEYQPSNDAGLARKLQRR